MAFIPGNSGTPSTFPDGFQVSDGTVTAPTFRFSDTQTGWYRSGLNQMALASAGVQTILVSATGAVTVGPISGLTTPHIFRAQPTTDYVARFENNAGGSGSTARILLASSGTNAGAKFVISPTGTGKSLFQFLNSTGVDFENTAGTPILSGTDAGAWTLGPSSGFAGIFTHKFNGSIKILGNIPASATEANALLIDKNGTNARFYSCGPDVSNRGAYEFYTIASDGTSPLLAMQISAAGAVSLGPTAGVGLNWSAGHAITGATRLQLSNMGASGSPTFPTSTNHLAIGWNRSDAQQEVVFMKGTAGGGTDAFAWYAATSTTAATFLGGITNAGAWTLGPSGGTSRGHVINTGDGSGGAAVLLSTSADTVLNADTRFSVFINGQEQAQIGSFRNAGTGAKGAGYLFVRNGNSTDYVYYVGNDGNFRQSTTKNDVGLIAGTVVGTQTSDARLKTEIETLGTGLSSIMALRPVSFKFNHTPDRTRLGFIAQEAELVIPSSVYEGGSFAEDGSRYKNMEYTEIIAPMVKAIQELKAENDALAARIQTIEGGQ